MTWKGRKPKKNDMREFELCKFPEKLTDGRQVL